MARSSKLCVMISSRCNDKFPADPAGRPLSEIRKELKKEIEAFEIFDKKIFEVWINEAEPPKGGTWDSWDVCLQAVKDCDIFIALSNGNAGWSKDGGDIGICGRVERGCEPEERAGRDMGRAGGCGTVNHLLQMGSI